MKNELSTIAKKLKDNFIEALKFQWDSRRFDLFIEPISKTLQDKEVAVLDGLKAFLER